MVLSQYPVWVAALLAFIWGAVWAVFLQFTPIGRFLAVRRTWITVVIGVGGVMGVAFLFIPADVWWMMLVLFGCASCPIIFRSLYNELLDQKHNLEDLDD